MGKSAPKVQTPDPAKTAAAQTASNKETALWNSVLNNVNQVTPYGTLSYTQNPAASADQPPTFTATTTLDPSQQRQLDLSNEIAEKSLTTGKGLIGNIEAATADRFQVAGQPPLPGDYSADRDKIQSELYDRSMSRLEPQFQRDTSALENKLINQGLTRGSEAFDEALKQNQYGINDARNSAMSSAINQAGNEQSRMFGLAMQGRQQGIQESLTERNQPINEVATLLGLGGNIQNPNFVNAQSVSAQPGNTEQNVWNSYNAQVAQANQQANARAQGINNIFGLAGTLGSAYMMSDRRQKKDIKHIGTWHNGLPIYSFTYIHDKSGRVHVGFMADEVRAVKPGAVKTFFGVDHVNYAEAMA